MKKLLATLLASTMALSVVGGLAACGEKEAKEVAATGISLNRATMSLVPDGSKGIIPELTPANATSKITWTSSNPAIATVNDGYVQALDSGTVTITAEANGKKATCVVTVGDWLGYKMVGSINGWAPDDAQYVFQQDATDKHKWTLNGVELTATSEVKIVAAKKNESGEYVGAGWGGGLNMGTIKDANLKEGQHNKITGNSGTIDLVGSDEQNIKADAGTYNFTIKVKVGGGIESFSYELASAA